MRSVERRLLLACILLFGCARSPAHSSTPGVIRASSSGVRFPANPEQLANEVDRLLAQAGLPAPGAVRAIVVPHAAIEFSGEAAAAAIAPIRDRRFERVILLAGGHPVLAHGAYLPQAKAFRTPLGDMPVDTAALELVPSTFTRGDAPFMGEHAIDPVLPFLQRAIGNVPLVPLLLGSIDAAGARAIADALRPLVDSRTLVVVSTNLTHAGPRFHNAMFGEDSGETLRARMQQADQILLAPLLRGDLARFDALARDTHTTMCGQDAARVLLALLPQGATGTVRLYANSFAHDQGPRQNQVSYAGIVFPGSWPDVAPLPRGDAQALLASVHEALAAAVEKRAPPPPARGSIRVLEKRGAFLTLYEDGQLRASVGQLASDEPLAQTVTSLASAAAEGKDTRFPPLAQQDVAKIKVELAVLGPQRPASDMAEVDLAREALYLDAPGHTALLLPDRHAHAPSLDEALAALATKADLPREKWPEGKLTRFAVQFAADDGAELVAGP